jgi:excisionase family DNA binding protein
LKQSAEATADKLLTVEQVADYLNVSKAQTYLLIRRTGFPLIELGPRLLRVRLSQLDAWLASVAA